MKLQDRVDELRGVMNHLVTHHANSSLAISGALHQAGMDDETPAILAEHTMPYVDLAADYTAQWYEDIDPDLGFPTHADHGVTPQRIRRASGQPMQKFLAGAQRMIYDGSRETVMKNAQTEGAQVFRHAPESACQLCRNLTVLPTIGQQTRMTSHDDDCQCLAVPQRPGHRYRHPGYVRDWAASMLSANNGPVVAGMARKSV